MQVFVHQHSLAIDTKLVTDEKLKVWQELFEKQVHSRVEKELEI